MLDAESIGPAKFSPRAKNIVPKCLQAQSLKLLQKGEKEDRIDGN